MSEFQQQQEAAMIQFERKMKDFLDEIVEEIDKDLLNRGLIETHNYTDKIGFCKTFIFDGQPVFSQLVELHPNQKTDIINHLSFIPYVN